jgi:hypothetical protein
MLRRPAARRPMLVCMDSSGTLPPPRRSWYRALAFGLAGLAAVVVTAVIVYGLVVLAIGVAVVLLMNGFGSNK